MEGKGGQRDVEYREKRAKQEQQGRARSCFQVQGQTASSSVKHVQNGSFLLRTRSFETRPFIEYMTYELRWLPNNRA